MPEKKLHILYHFRVRGTGAEGVHIAGIVNGFRASGHRVTLLSPTNADPTGDAPAAVTQKNSPSFTTVLLHKLADKLPQPFFELMEICYNVPAVIRLLRAVGRAETDFIYERYAFFNVAGAFVAQRKNIPFIVEVNELSGHKRIRGQFFVRLCSVFERYVLCRAEVVVTVSDFLNKEVRNKVKPRGTRVVTIPNGVPQSWLEKEISINEISSLREKYGLQEKRIICFVGGLVHWHNFDLLLEAVKNVRDVLPDVVLMFIGDGPLRGYIREKAHALSLPSESVVFVGKVAHSEIPVYLKMVDLAVIPETNEFRSPIKMFEYMAMGLAVVAPRKPAIEVAISHAKNGMLFEPGNPLSLAQTLLRCLSDPQLLVTLGENARQKILENFTWEKHAAYMLHLLEVGK